MEISYRIEKKVCILTLLGHFQRQTISEFDVAMEGQLKNKELEGIIIDLEGVQFIDSFGIGHIVDTFNQLKDRGVFLEICSLPGKIGFLFEMMNLHRVLTIHSDQETALASR